MLRSQPVPESPAPVALGERPRILVVKLASLGDLLLATPALRALRQRYPAARLDVLTTVGAAPLLRDSPLVDTIYTLNKYAFDEPLAGIRRLDAMRAALALGSQLRSSRYDAALLLHHLTLPFGRLKYRALLQVIGARCTAGLDNGWGHYLDLRVPDLGFGWRHEAEYNLAVSEVVEAPPSADGQGLRVADLGWNDLARTRRQRPTSLALHPGSGSYSIARRWPATRWAELAQALRDDTGAEIILVGGPDERSLLDDISGRLERPAWLRIAGSGGGARELAQTLSSCALLVANDSFPMHLATAVGTPTVAVFGPSNARAWGPYAPDRPDTFAVVRRADLQCSPCFYRGQSLGTPQGCAQRPCLTALPLQPVLAAARRLLAQQVAGAQPAG
jgi:ADP-heptose:LPS heptosyltransferase